MEVAIAILSVADASFLVLVVVASGDVIHVVRLLTWSRLLLLMLAFFLRSMWQRLLVLCWPVLLF